jgi:hypothetical protein
MSDGPWPRQCVQQSKNSRESFSTSSGLPCRCLEWFFARSRDALKFLLRELRRLRRLRCRGKPRRRDTHTWNTGPMKLPNNLVLARNQAARIRPGRYMTEPYLLR